MELLFCHPSLLIAILPLPAPSSVGAGSDALGQKENPHSVLGQALARTSQDRWCHTDPSGPALAVCGFWPLGALGFTSPAAEGDKAAVGAELAQCELSCAPGPAPRSALPCPRLCHTGSPRASTGTPRWHRGPAR